MPELPAHPHLDHLRNAAKALHNAFIAGDSDAQTRVRQALGERSTIRLADAQRVIAREYGFSNWAKLRAWVEATRDALAAVDEAASLTFAIIRFAQGAAYMSRGSKQPHARLLGQDDFVFCPSPRRIPQQAVRAFLASLSSPAMLFPTTTKGVVALQLLGELTGDRALGAKKEFANQRDNLEGIIRQLGLTDESRVLVDLGGTAETVSVSVLRLWSERYAVHIGWSVSPLSGDSRAPARLNLYRSDGVDLPSRSNPGGR